VGRPCDSPLTPQGRFLLCRLSRRLESGIPAPHALRDDGHLPALCPASGGIVTWSSAPTACITARPPSSAHRLTVDPRSPNHPCAARVPPGPADGRDVLVHNILSHWTRARTEERTVAIGCGTRSVPTGASASEPVQTRALASWLHQYNHHRVLTAIGGPPVSGVTNRSGGAQLDPNGNAARWEERVLEQEITSTYPQSIPSRA